jgi:dethiobiotin synthetase
VTRGVFVTGTDTGVGKTFAACVLIHALRSQGLRVAPMKPVAAGAIRHGRGFANEDTLALAAAAGPHAPPPGMLTPVLLQQAMAPHIAAEREGRVITLAPVLEARERVAAAADFLVVEGVGGWQVPLGPSLDTVDLARAMALPVILVVGLRLGCLNHALLTAAAIAASGLACKGWIANAIEPDMPGREENIAALVARLPAPLLGQLPFAAGTSARDLATRLDVASLLA